MTTYHKYSEWTGETQISIGELIDSIKADIADQMPCGPFDFDCKAAQDERFKEVWRKMQRGYVHQTSASKMCYYFGDAYVRQRFDNLHWFKPDNTRVTFDDLLHTRTVSFEEDSVRVMYNATGQYEVWSRDLVIQLTAGHSYYPSCDAKLTSVQMFDNGRGEIVTQVTIN